MPLSKFFRSSLTPPLTGGDNKKNLDRVVDPSRYVSERFSQVVIRNGKSVEQLLRRPTAGNLAFIDQLTFVFDKDSIPELLGREASEFEYYDQYVAALNTYLIDIFGFVASHDRGRMHNFYYSSYNLGDRQRCYGYVCLGGTINQGNADSICVEITATGLAAAEDGWEHRLYTFSRLPEVSGFHYTRVDLTHDFLRGEWSVDDVLAHYRQGGFTNAHTCPKLECVGSDFWNDTQTGKTVYIGSRQSSRLLRCYEKGKQLGDKDSPWLRCELELRSRDIVIPLDIVFRAGDYLVAAYPCMLSLLPSDTPEKPLVRERLIQRGIEHTLKYARIQASKAVNMLRSLGISAEDIVSLFNPDAGLPKGYDPGRYYAAALDVDFITHKFTEPVLSTLPV